MKGVLGIDDLRGIGSIVAEGCDVGNLLPLVEPRVVIDSRMVTGGEVFVALAGEQTDGHRYVDEVFSRGALWAVVSEAWYATRPEARDTVPRRYLVVADTVAALQQMASVYRGTFSVPVLGVGGSNGKTTTKELLASVLATVFRVQMSCGNRNNHLGVPLTLLQMKRDTELAVVEMGINRPGEMELLVSIARPTHALLTNIGHEHLEFLHGLAGVAEAESALYRYVDRNGGTCFVNIADPWLARAAAGLQRTVRYGLDHCQRGVPHAEGITLDVLGRPSFRLCLGAERQQVSLKLVGRHNVLNSLAAAAVGTHFGLSLSLIREGLEKLLPAPGWKRLEFQEAEGVVVVNDTYNANPDSMRLAIDLLCELHCPGRKIAVLGDMLELGESSMLEHERIGRYIQQSSIDLLFTFGDHSKGYVTGNESRLFGHFGSRESLFRSLADFVVPGDAVLFKASRGMRLEEVADALCRKRTRP